MENEDDWNPDGEAAHKANQDLQEGSRAPTERCTTLTFSEQKSGETPSAGRSLQPTTCPPLLHFTESP